MKRTDKVRVRVAGFQLALQHKEGTDLCVASDGSLHTVPVLSDLSRGQEGGEVRSVAPVIASNLSESDHETRR